MYLREGGNDWDLVSWPIFIFIFFQEVFDFFALDRLWKYL